MLISEFIQQLQDVYDEEGDMEIAINHKVALRNSSEGNYLGMMSQ